MKSQHCPLLSCILADTRSSFDRVPSQMPPICRSRPAVSSAHLARLAVESPIWLSLPSLAKVEKLSLRRTSAVLALDALLKLVEELHLVTKMH